MIKLLFTVFANYSYVIVNFFLIAIISQRFNSDSLGSYLHTFVVINLLIIVFKFGNENYLLRTGLHNKLSIVRAKTMFLTLFFPVLAVVLILGFFNNSLFFYFLPYIFGFTYLTLMVAYYKSRDVNKSFWLNLLVFSLIPLFNLFIIFFFEPKLELIVLILGLLYFLVATYFYLRNINISFRLIVNKDYLKECFQYFVLAVGSVMATSSSSLIIGFFLDDKLTGSYIVLEKITDLILMSTTIIAVLSSKNLVQSFNTQVKFKKVYHDFLLRTLLLAVVITIFTILVLDEILTFLNFEYFNNYEVVIYILLLGKFIICCFGPALLIIAISNHRTELIFSYILIIMFNLILGSLLISYFSVIGAAINSIITVMILRAVFYNKIRLRYFYDNN